MTSARFRFRSLSWLAVTLCAALATSNVASAQSSADDGELREPVKTPRIAVSAIMAEVGQALIWDADRGEYVVLRVGSWIQGHRIRAIFPNQVVLAGTGGQSFVFALTPRDRLNRELGNSVGAPAGSADAATGPINPYAGPSTSKTPTPIPSVIAPPRSRAEAPPAPQVTPRPADAMALPADPFEEPGDRGAAPAQQPVDPYAGLKRPEAQPPSGLGIAPAQPSEATQPLDPYAAGRAPAPARPGPSEKAQAPVDPYAARSATEPKPVDPYAYGNDERVVALPPAVVGGEGNAADSRPPAPRGAVKKMTLERGELDAALSDFHRLSQEIELEAASEGGFKVTSLKRRSYFHRIGLRRGDVILDVAGIPLRSVDDAASVYAQVAASQDFSARLVRRGKPLTIQYRFSRR